MHNQENTACFTGHRKLPSMNMMIKIKLKKTIVKLIKKGVVYFGNGGALGFDTLAALTVIKLKSKYPQIKLIMVLPCKEQDNKWMDEDKRIYNYILEKSDKIVYTSVRYYSGCMHKRNKHLVENSSYCIAYLNKSTGGTAYTVNLALKSGVEVIYI